MQKKYMKSYNMQSLIKLLNHTQETLIREFPDTTVNFNFDKKYYKKHDSKNFRKQKRLIQLLQELSLIVQEFRSRGFSLIQIADLETDNHSKILQSSFREEVEI